MRTGGGGASGPRGDPERAGEIASPDCLSMKRRLGLSAHWFYSRRFNLEQFTNLTYLTDPRNLNAGLQTHSDYDSLLLYNAVFM